MNLRAHLRGFYFFGFCLAIFFPLGVLAAGSLPSVTFNLGQLTGPNEISTTLQILFMITILSLTPAIIVTMTSFTRFVIVFSLLRQALGAHQIPPNQVLVGLALFLSLAVMSPTLNQIYSEAIKPYQEDKISVQEALKKAEYSMRNFMLHHTREKDLGLFLSLSKTKKPQTQQDISMAHVVPAFIISELKTAFQIGFMIYIPFIVIDIVVASVLLAMGMLVLPPVIISLPFKLMLFVLVDGWNLVAGSLIRSFGSAL